MPAINPTFGYTVGATQGGAPMATPPPYTQYGSPPPSADATDFNNRFTTHQTALNPTLTPEEQRILREAGVDPGALGGEALNRLAAWQPGQSVGPPPKGGIVNDPAQAIAAAQRGELSPGLLNGLQALQQIGPGQSLDRVFTQQRQDLKGNHRNELKALLSGMLTSEPPVSPYEIDDFYKTNRPGGDLTRQDVRQMLRELGHPVSWLGRIGWRVSSFFQSIGNFFRRLFGLSTPNAPPPAYSEYDQNPPPPYSPGTSPA
jgi:hypothetical protein